MAIYNPFPLWLVCQLVWECKLVAVIYSLVAVAAAVSGP